VMGVLEFMLLDGGIGLAQCNVHATAYTYTMHGLKDALAVVESSPRSTSCTPYTWRVVYVACHIRCLLTCFIVI
jgi:hypothetical protein